MTSFRKQTLLGLGLAVMAWTLRAELEPWVQHVPAQARAYAAFFRTVVMPSGPLQIRRPAAESAGELGKLIAATPNEAELYALRGHEREQVLDFKGAESDWQAHAKLNASPLEGQVALADYYHRRSQPADEAKVLLAAARLPAAGPDRFRVRQNQRSWQLLDRLERLAAAQALPSAVAREAHEIRVARYPDTLAAHLAYVDFFLAQKDPVSTAKAIDAMAARFPAAPDVLTARARLAGVVGRDAVSTLDAAWQPLWPAALVQAYMTALDERGGTRAYVNAQRAALVRDPGDFGAAVRLFQWHRHREDLASAEYVLAQFRAAREASGKLWTAEELSTMAQLLAGIHSYQQAARLYHALYALPGVTNSQAEQGLAGLIRLLLDAPESAIRLGQGDLSLYTDLAQADQGPGFLNGVLSLVLNNSDLARRFTDQEQMSVSYWHRVQAAELLRLFDQRFSSSTARPQLHGKLIAAYSVYGARDAVIRHGERFLQQFPGSSERTDVAFQLADAYARANQRAKEFALYDQLLAEQAKAALGVPIGDASMQPEGQGATPRSAAYDRVLNRYLARLTAAKQLPQALTLYRREIDRNPEDPGLYERLAAFLEENSRTAEVDTVYRQAMNRFNDPSWSHKLARWYLRQKKQAQFTALTQEVVSAFSGSALEKYLREALAGGEVSDQLYLQVHRFAQTKFPHNVTFVKALIDAYGRPGIANRQERLRLLRANWQFDPELRDQYLAALSSSGQLESELAAVRASLGKLSAWDTLAAANPAAVQWIGEAEAWRSHFEEAAEPLRAVAALQPGQESHVLRAVSLHRSLGAFDGRFARTAVSLGEAHLRWAPRNKELLAALGEIDAELGRDRAAGLWWNRISQVAPGDPGGYLETATVYWDYFRFDEALDEITAARRRFADTTLFGYEAGAIYENRRQQQQAVAEYVRAAVQQGPESQAALRLLSLARRTQWQPLVEAATAPLLMNSRVTLAAARVRLSILEAQNRRADLEQALTSLARRGEQSDLVEEARTTAVRLGLPAVEETALTTQVAAAADPVQRLGLQLRQAAVLESRQRMPEAERLLNSLAQAHPALLGLVRAQVGFYRRRGQWNNVVDTLQSAAGRAHTDLRRLLLLEGAQAANEGKFYGRARQLLQPLAQAAPLDTAVINLWADSLAREGRTQELTAFWSEKVKLAAREPEALAGLRRAFIPVLERQGDHPGAVDQYMALLNRYPQDSPLLNELASYANRYGQQQRVLDFYRRTVTQSPRDARFAVALARLQVRFETLPAAIETFTQALAVRPDRADLFLERAELRERLGRFAEAGQDYEKLYELSYRDPQWRERQAVVQLRLGRPDEAIRLLRSAWLTSGGERPETYVKLANRLADWGLLDAARADAEKAVALRQQPEPNEWATLLRVALLQRKTGEVWGKLSAAFTSEPLLPGWALHNPAQEAGRVYAPEEKQTLAQFLVAQNKLAASDAMRAALIAVARGAGLAEAEARLLIDSLIRSPGAPNTGEWLQRLQALERQRLQYSELGGALEQYAATADANQRPSLLEQAAQVYQEGGVTSAEIRARAKLAPSARYFELLAGRAPERLLAAAAESDEGTRWNALAAALDAGNPSLTQQLLPLAAKGQPTFWQAAYTALAGSYISLPGDTTSSAYRALLGSQAVADQLGRPADRQQQLAGRLWFTYAGNYGDYLFRNRQASSEDYLLGRAEGAPASPSVYLEMAELFAESRDLPRAIAAVERALEFRPEHQEWQSKAALFQWQHGQQSVAIARWERILTSLKTSSQAVALGPILADLQTAGQLNRFRSRLGDIALAKTTATGGAVFAELATVVGQTSDGSAWLLDLASRAQEPAVALTTLEASLAPEPALQEQLLLHLVTALDRGYAAASGDQRTAARETLLTRRRELIVLLLSQGKAAGAGEEYRRWRDLNGAPAAALALPVAALQGRLDEEIQSLAALESVPSEWLEAAHLLRRVGQEQAAQRVTERLYERELAAQRLEPSYFLGLAEVRLQQGRPDEAVALVRRLTTVVGRPFEQHAAAARLLVSAGRPDLAAPLWRALAEAEPWNGEARLAAASDAGQLAAALLLPTAPYEAKVDSARRAAAAHWHMPNTLSAELAAIAAGVPEAAATEKPYAVEGRLSAAQKVADPAVKVRLLSMVLSYDPQRSLARWQLQQAAVAAGRPRLGSLALTPLLQFSAAPLPGVSRSMLLQQAAQLRAAAGDLREAVDLLRRCQYEEEVQPADRASVAPRLRELEGRLAIVQADLARRPVVAAGVEQPHVVRPRLIGAVKERP